MARFRKRVQEIEAERWFPGMTLMKGVTPLSEVGDWDAQEIYRAERLPLPYEEHVGEYGFILNTVGEQRGRAIVRSGDWVCRDVNDPDGCLWPLRPHAFDRVYYLVERDEG